MPDTVFIEKTSGSFPSRNIIFDRGGTISFRYFVGEYHLASSNSIFIAETHNLPPSERDFREQEQAFKTIPPLLLEPYRGQYVVSRDGRIVDSDIDLPTLTSRFFTDHGDLPVYITKIGEDMEVVVDTPFLD